MVRLQICSSGIWAPAKEVGNHTSTGTIACTKNQKICSDYRVPASLKFVVCSSLSCNSQQLVLHGFNCWSAWYKVRDRLEAGNLTSTCWTLGFPFLAFPLKVRRNW